MLPESPRRRMSWQGVRLDAALVAVSVVVAALAVAAVLLVSLTRAELVRSVEAVVITRSQDLAQLVATGELPAVLPLSRSTSAQVIDTAGRVIASTGDIEGQAPIVAAIGVTDAVTTLTIPSLDSGDDGEQEGEADDDEGPYLVAVASAEAPTGQVVILVAGSLAAAEAATSTLTPLLIWGIPLLALVVGVTTWMLAGRTLRPVRLMTEEAGRITASDLERRIPLPGGGDEIQRLAETLNQMLDRLDHSIAAQRRFVADASHELKSPLASLLAMTEVALQHPETIDLGRFAADAHDESKRLALLVDDLLTLARSDERAFVLERFPFDLSALLTEEASRLSLGVTVHVAQTEPIFIEADRRRLAQAVRNVIDNASRHAAGNVWVETREADDCVDIVVVDDGPGIPNADREKIFDRFVRLDDARSRDQGGTGLGLSVVQTIVEAHGGSVAVIDHPKHTGAAIRIRLPVRSVDG